MIRKLTEKDRNDFMCLSNNVLKVLPRSDFFICMTREEEKVLFNDSFCIVYGVFDDNKLIAISCLYHHQQNDIANYLSLSGDMCAEIGHCMVLPQYRGKNLMVDLNKQLIIEAKKIGIKYLLATAHPENISSNKSLSKLGMKNIGKFMRNKNYDRNIYFMEL